MRLYATTAEHRRITAAAEKAGKSISDFLRDAALAEVCA